MLTHYMGTPQRPLMHTLNAGAISHSVPELR